MYKEQEYFFIDNLLKNTSNKNLTYEELSNFDYFDYNLYESLFTNINKYPYKLVEFDGNKYTITPLGRVVSKIGFKKYLDNIKGEQEIDMSIKLLTIGDLKRTDKRSKSALIVSLIAIIVAIVIGLVQIYQSYFYNKKIENQEQK